MLEGRARIRKLGRLFLFFDTKKNNSKNNKHDRMTSKRIKNERGGSSVVKRETPEEDNDSCGDFKITIKAHFQIAQPKIDDPASFRFKALYSDRSRAMQYGRSG